MISFFVISFHLLKQGQIEPINTIPPRKDLEFFHTLSRQGMRKGLTAKFRMTFQKSRADTAVLIPFQSARTVKEPAAGLYTSRGLGKDFFLEGRELTEGPLLFGPARFCPTVKDAETRTGSIDKNRVGPVFKTRKGLCPIMKQGSDIRDSKTSGIFFNKGKPWSWISMAMISPLFSIFGPDGSLCRQGPHKNQGPSPPA